MVLTISSPQFVNVKGMLALFNDLVEALTVNEIWYAESVLHLTKPVSLNNAIVL